MVATRLRAWFDDADVSGSGALSIGEFFRWSLRNVAERHGAEGMKALFGAYDADGSGVITMREFQRACESTGFGLAAPSIFRTLDVRVRAPRPRRHNAHARANRRDGVVCGRT